MNHVLKTMSFLPQSRKGRREGDFESNHQYLPTRGRPFFMGAG